MTQDKPSKPQNAAHAVERITQAMRVFLSGDFQEPPKISGPAAVAARLQEDLRWSKAIEDLSQVADQVTAVVAGEDLDGVAPASPSPPPDRVDEDDENLVGVDCLGCHSGCSAPEDAALDVAHRNQVRFAALPAGTRVLYRDISSLSYQATSIRGELLESPTGENVAIAWENDEAPSPCPVGNFGLDPDDDPEFAWLDEFDDKGDELDGKQRLWRQCRVCEFEYPTDTLRDTPEDEEGEILRVEHTDEGIEVSGTLVTHVTEMMARGRLAEQMKTSHVDILHIETNYGDPRGLVAFILANIHDGVGEDGKPIYKKWKFEKVFSVSTAIAEGEENDEPPVQRIWREAADWISRAVMHLNQETRPPEIPVPSSCPLVVGCLNCGTGLGYAGSQFCDTSCQAEFEAA